jgi:hypothetical protein
MLQTIAIARMELLWATTQQHGIEALALSPGKFDLESKALKISELRAFAIFCCSLVSDCWIREFNSQS